MRPKFFLWLVGSILALGLVIRVGSALMSYIAPLALVDARVLATAPTPAPILKPPAHVAADIAADISKQAILDLSMRADGDGVLRITNRNKETYRRLLLRLIVGADYTSWTTVLRDIAPGNTIPVRLQDITNDRGQRFDPVLWRPRSRRYGPLIVIEGTLA